MRLTIFLILLPQLHSVRFPTRDAALTQAVCGFDDTHASEGIPASVGGPWGEYSRSHLRYLNEGRILFFADVSWIGLGDRLTAVGNALLFAMATNRSFIFDDGSPLQEVFEPAFIEWRASRVLEPEHLRLRAKVAHVQSRDDAAPAVSISGSSQVLPGVALDWPYSFLLGCALRLLFALREDLLLFARNVAVKQLDPGFSAYRLLFESPPFSAVQMRFGDYYAFPAFDETSTDARVLPAKQNVEYTLACAQKKFEGQHSQVVVAFVSDLKEARELTASMGSLRTLNITPQHLGSMLSDDGSVLPTRRNELRELILELLLLVKAEKLLVSGHRPEREDFYCNPFGGRHGWRNCNEYIFSQRPSSFSTAAIALGLLGPFDIIYLGTDCANSGEVSSSWELRNRDASDLPFPITSKLGEELQRMADAVLGSRTRLRVSTARAHEALPQHVVVGRTWAAMLIGRNVSRPWQSPIDFKSACGIAYRARRSWHLWNGSSWFPADAIELWRGRSLNAFVIGVVTADSQSMLLHKTWVLVTAPIACSVADVLQFVAPRAIAGMLPHPRPSIKEMLAVTIPEAAASCALEHVHWNQELLFTVSMTAGFREGFFVEIGHDSNFQMSSTYLLECGFAWKGVCIEPFLSNQKITRTRTCAFDDSMLGATMGKIVEVVPGDAFAETMPKFHLATWTLESVLTRHHAPAMIDFVSVSGQFCEASLLASLPLETFSIGILVVKHEHVEGRREQSRQVLKQRGFRLAHGLELADWYVHPRIHSPRPGVALLLND